MHETVSMTTWAGDVVEIDTAISPLIQKMWDHGIRTRWCCQGDTGLFLDDTCYEAKGDRAYIMMENDRVSRAFITGLMTDSHFFSAEKVAWTMEFDREPDRPDARRANSNFHGMNRITIRFPHQDIKALVDYFQMKEEMAAFTRQSSVFWK